MIFSILLTTGLFALPVPVPAHDQDSLKDQGDENAMIAFYDTDMIGRGMGMGGCDRVGMGMAGSGCGMGMAEGRGRGMIDLRQISMLDLTLEQRSRLNKIQYDLRKQHWALNGKIIDEQAKLHDLYTADRPDAKKIGSIYGAIFDVRRQMIEAKIEAANRARELLTREQIDMLRQSRQHGSMMGTGPIHHEMHHDMMKGGTGTGR